MLMAEERKYKTRQVWQAAWPMCWKVRLMFVEVVDHVPLFTAESAGMLFHRGCNETDYLFSAEGLDRLLGDEAVLMEDKEC